MYMTKERSKMIEVSATKLRNNLFDYLDKASEGETIIIRRNNREVARLVPTQQADWREKMRTKPKLLVTPEMLIEPMENIWKDYTSRRPFDPLEERPKQDDKVT